MQSAVLADLACLAVYYPGVSGLTFTPDPIDNVGSVLRCGWLLPHLPHSNITTHH